MDGDRAVRAPDAVRAAGTPTTASRCSTAASPRSTPPPTRSSRGSSAVDHAAPPADEPGLAAGPARVPVRLLGAGRRAARRCYVADEYHGGHARLARVRRRPGGGPAGRRHARRARSARHDHAHDAARAAHVLDGMPAPALVGVRGRPHQLRRRHARTPPTSRKLLFIEFALVYSQRLVPRAVHAAGGSLAARARAGRHQRLRRAIWIEAAGQRRRRRLAALEHVHARRRGDAACPPTQPAAAADRAEGAGGPPLEEVVLIRDEMANMVWASSGRSPLPDGVSRRGAERRRETRAYFERLGRPTRTSVTRRRCRDAPHPLRRDDTRAGALDPVHPGARARARNREIQLQRAAMLRVIEGDPAPPRRCGRATSLLRAGLDQSAPAPYFVPRGGGPARRRASSRSATSARAGATAARRLARRAQADRPRRGVQRPGVRPPDRPAGQRRGLSERSGRTPAPTSARPRPRSAHRAADPEKARSNVQSVSSGTARAELRLPRRRRGRSAEPAPRRGPPDCWRYLVGVQEAGAPAGADTLSGCAGAMISGDGGSARHGRAAARRGPPRAGPAHAEAAGRPAGRTPCWSTSAPTRSAPATASCRAPARAVQRARVALRSGKPSPRPGARAARRANSC